MGPDREGHGGDLLCKNGWQLSVIFQQGADVTPFVEDEASGPVGFTASAWFVERLLDSTQQELCTRSSKEFSEVSGGSQELKRNLLLGLWFGRVVKLYDEVISSAKSLLTAELAGDLQRPGCCEGSGPLPLCVLFTSWRMLSREGCMEEKTPRWIELLIQ